MSEIIDLKDALERVQDDKELLLELFDIFQEDFVTKQKALWDAYNQGIVTQFQMAAHSLKGATGNISARQMHENCIELDRIAKEGNISTVKERLQLLDNQFEALKAEILRLKKEFKG